MNNQTRMLPGFWERKKRNPVTAAFILIMVIGGVYFLFQTVVMNGFILISQLLDSDRSGLRELSFVELQNRVYDKYRIAIVVIVTLSQFLILLGATLFILPKWHHGDHKSYFRLHRFNGLALAFGLLSGVIIIPLVDWLSRWFYIFFPFLKELSQMGDGLVRSKNPIELGVLVLGIGLTPAICEEVLFRGYFQRTLQRRISSPWPIIIAGVIFALYHQNFFSLPVHILVGIYMGFLFYRFDSLYASMGFHFAYNTSLVILSYMNQANIPAFLVTTEGNFRSTVVAVSIALLAGLVVAILRITRPLSLVAQNQTVLDQLAPESEDCQELTPGPLRAIENPGAYPEIYSNNQNGSGSGTSSAAGLREFQVKLTGDDQVPGSHIEPEDHSQSEKDEAESSGP
ncbi:MAG: CPBP family intramembrane metalloprotease [Spirochaetales bacterium]|nr:CPBP family intramembrane metalloprotease [Spirochaetales bacterium]